MCLLQFEVVRVSRAALTAVIDPETGIKQKVEQSVEDGSVSLHVKNSLLRLEGKSREQLSKAAAVLRDAIKSFTEAVCSSVMLVSVPFGLMFAQRHHFMCICLNRRFFSGSFIVQYDVLYFFSV